MMRARASTISRTSWVSRRRCLSVTWRLQPKLAAWHSEAPASRHLLLRIAVAVKAGGAGRQPDVARAQGAALRQVARGGLSGGLQPGGAKPQAWNLEWRSKRGRTRWVWHLSIGGLLWWTMYGSDREK